MALGNPLVRLVAGVVEPKWVTIIRFPLDDVAGVGGRNLANFVGLITARCGIAVVEKDDVAVPGVAGQLDRALEKQPFVGAGRCGLVLGAHQHLGSYQIVPQLAMLERFVLACQLSFQAAYGGWAGIGRHAGCAFPAVGRDIAPPACFEAGVYFRLTAGIGPASGAAAVTTPGGVGQVLFVVAGEHVQRQHDLLVVVPVDGVVGLVLGPCQGRQQ